MAPKENITPDEDVKLLLTVIKQLSGSVDWEKVSTELDITSKGAAAKRYSRLPKKYGIVMPEKAKGGTSPGADVPTTPKKKGKGGASKVTTSSKKRKMSEEADAEDEDDNPVKAEESE